jgi:hypothetical protein
MAFLALGKARPHHCYDLLEIGQSDVENQAQAQRQHNQ